MFFWGGRIEAVYNGLVRCCLSCFSDITQLDEDEVQGMVSELLSLVLCSVCIASHSEDGRTWDMVWYGMVWYGVVGKDMV